MLRKLRSRNNNLSARYIVVWQEDHFEKVADISVSVDNSTDGID